MSDKRWLVLDAMGVIYRAGDDVAELDGVIDPWCISGEIGVRKPDEKAYLTLLEMLSADAAECLFVDDRPKNLAAARAVGMRAIQFDAARGGSLADLEGQLT